MNRFLQIFNLCGVLTLAALCIVQWQGNRRLNLQKISLETARDRQAAKIADEAAVIKGGVDDLNDFRARFTAAEKALTDSDAQLQSAKAQGRQLAAERDQLKMTADNLKAALTQWTAAVATRDQALKDAARQAQSLANDRNAAIAKFNDLASRYNASADEIKKANAEIQRLAAERNDAVAKFNDLAAKYNALVKQPPASTTRP